jgi:protein-S-isoprenylcysteine O-methyltransferase Ste14
MDVPALAIAEPQAGRPAGGRLGRSLAALAAGAGTLGLLTAAAWLGGEGPRTSVLIFVLLATLASALEAAVAPATDRSGPGRAAQLAQASGLLLLGIWTTSLAAPGGARPPAAWLAGAAMLALGALLRAAAIARLGARFNSDNRIEAGAALETAGLYRRLAHPSELGLVLLAAGAVLMVGGPAQAAIAAALYGVTAWRMRLEERALIAAHGPAYAAYRRATWDPIPNWCAGANK